MTGTRDSLTGRRTAEHPAVPASDADRGVGAAIDRVLAHVRELTGAQPDAPFLLGTCNVCGARTAFVWRDRAPLRESLSCLGCRTTSRYRSMARGLLLAIRELAGIEAPSLAELPRTGPPLRIYDTQVAFDHPPGAAYPLPDLLAETGWIEVMTSRYLPDRPWGDRLGPSTTNQTLEALTFADASVDVLLTSDVMEHVRLDARAHREIARVVRPGGRYLFTVPHSRALERTLERVRVHDEADPDRDEHLLDPEYHGTADPSASGTLSYRVYGTDLDATLAAVGFAVDYHYDQVPEHGILDTELFVCRRAR